METKPFKGNLLGYLGHLIANAEMFVTSNIFFFVGN